MRLVNSRSLTCVPVYCEVHQVIAALDMRAMSTLVLYTILSARCQVRQVNGALELRAKSTLVNETIVPVYT